MKLLKIVSNVQRIAEVISSVIKVDVTIVDNNLNRIAGTGRYHQYVGMPVSSSSVFGFAIREGEGFIIENPRNHSVCLKCEDKVDCKEYAQVCCPIKVNNETIGVIGLIAFYEEQRRAILSNQSNLMEFLNGMADLIASKLLDQEKTDKIKLLAKELEIVLDSVDRGIVAADPHGKVLHYNKKAAQIFQIPEMDFLSINVNDLLNNIDLHDLISKRICIKNREFNYNRGGYHFRGVFSTNPITSDNRNLGNLYTFSNISEILTVVNEMTGGTIVTSFDSIIGKSECLERVKNQAKKASNTTSTVLIQGESGTGKELFARAIHFHGNRAKGSFIPINCAAIPEQLLESELFGYEEGAFTGSRRGGKAGKFELANKGTLFLDEIGDMAIHLQTKLLRVLQEGVIEKIGGKEYIPIDVRIIAATNKDLEQKVKDGEFREDLFYRLNVIPLNIPPLRERKEDIIILVEDLLEKCNRKLGKNIGGIDEGIYELFMNYQWPGNVRELENTIEYAVNMCTDSVISPIYLPNRLKNMEYTKKERTFEGILTIKELEKREIQRAVHYYGRTKGGMEKAAKVLDISRATLYRKIKEYNI